MHRRVIGIAAMTALLGGDVVVADDAQPKQVLRVALFPYLPNTDTATHPEFGSRIEREFELQNPTVDLQLRPLNKVEGEFYEPRIVANWLRTPRAEPNARCTSERYDIVEIDAVFLDDLVALVEPEEAWNSKVVSAEWHPAAKQAGTIDGLLHGVPHWMCGYFLFSRSAAVDGATDAKGLVAALEALKTPARNLVGDMRGSWTLPTLYLDAWADANGSSDLLPALSLPLDEPTRALLRSVVSQCEPKSADEAEDNPCLGKTYSDNDRAPTEFAQGKADALLGYSERLNVILAQGGKDVQVAAAALGGGSSTLLFTDVFVRSPVCAGECSKAAEAFVRYMNAPETLGWMLMSADVMNGVPRYLLPANLAAFREKGLQSDTYYREFQTLIQGASSFPNARLFTARGRINERLKKDLAPPKAP